MDSAEIPISLKWSKQVFPLVIQIGDSARSFKEQVRKLTRVPVERQKLLCGKKKGPIYWKGSLRNDLIFAVAEDAKAISHPLAITLIGSAEAIEAPKVRTQFVEDMSEEERRAVDEAAEQTAMEDAIGMIPALQLPAYRRDDGKQEIYQYNRLVTGLPQRQIEDLVRQDNLAGTVAMTMGLELRRAYVNDLAVIESDGTLISGLDDGHIQLWRHAEMEHDVIHDGSSGGGVDSVLSIDSQSSRISFCTSGRGSIKLWSHDAKELVTIPTRVPGTSPVSLVQVPILHMNNNLICFAARFQITQHFNPGRFHLVPQDAEGRRRRAEAEASEAARRSIVSSMSKSIQVIYGSADGTSQLQSRLLVVDNETAALITCLTVVTPRNSSTALLVSGDATGGIRIWQPQVEVENGEDAIKFVQLSYTQLFPSDGGGCSIVCMEPIGEGYDLAVSTKPTAARTGIQVKNIVIPLPQAVYIIEISEGDWKIQVLGALTGHTKDAVYCMQALPNGDLLTGGGKMDATLQLWSSSQLFLKENVEESKILQSSQASRQISSLGYVFAMATLRDKKSGSSRFAIAAARYNTVKVLL